ncbi:hypothetical protein QJQ45_004504 [Haematococcus lacustris]|nr:hypothetical protein QJQ45_004504 [Haematococcus lacustris]
MAQFAAFSLLPSPIFVYDGERTEECRLVFANHAAVAAGAPAPLRYRSGRLLPGSAAEADAGWSIKPGRTLFDDVLELCCMSGGPLCFTQGPVGAKGSFWHAQAWSIQDGGKRIVVSVQHDVSTDKQAVIEAGKREEMALSRLAAAQRRYNDEQSALKRLALQLDAAVAELRHLISSAQLKIPTDLDTRLFNASDALRHFCQASDGDAEVLVDELQSPSMCGPGGSSVYKQHSIYSSGVSPPTPCLPQLNHPHHANEVDNSVVGQGKYNMALEDLSRLKATYDMNMSRPRTASGSVASGGQASSTQLRPSMLTHGTLRAASAASTASQHNSDYIAAPRSDVSGAGMSSFSTRSHAEIHSQALQATSGLHEQLTSQFTDMDTVLSHAAALAASIDLMQMQPDTMAPANARTAGQLELKHEEQLLQRTFFEEQLLKANAQAAEMKAMLDKAVLDAHEERQMLTAQLAKATADMAEYKAAHEKAGATAATAATATTAATMVLDATELKVEYDLLEGHAASQKTTLVKALTDRVVMRQEMGTNAAQLQKMQADNIDMKAAYDQSMAENTQRKAMFDSQLQDAHHVAHQMKAAYDKSTVSARNNKFAFDAQLNKATADAAEFKAAYDKSNVDAVEARSAFHAQLNKATVDATEMKSVWDKSTADAVEAKTVFDSQLNKANADAAEFKSAFDKSTVDAVEAKSAFDAQLNKATADAFEMKAGWDKSTADAVEAKTVFDSQLNKANADAAEFKSAFDKSTVDAVEAKSAFDAQLNKATADAFEMKAGWDKSTADAVEAKTVFDSQLNKANADAAEFKSAFDKSTVDAVEAKSAFDAQLNKATADAFEMKAGWDKSTADAVEAKTVFDSQLNKANADAAEFKSAFDKSTVDAVEAKSAFDAQLNKATADAFEMKAGWDKSTADAVEAKTVFDSQLNKANADAAEFKSAFDKSTVDAVEAKSAFDAQLNSATADAFEMKAGWDKSTADAVEAKTVFDSQLNKANADAAEFKSAFDKSTVDAVEAKSAFDAQLNSATADAFEMKAGWDKSTADVVEAKTVFDSQLNKANADAAEFKSAFDKSTVDAVEAKSAFDAQLNKATADAFEMKAGWDKSTADAVEAKTVFDSQLNKANADAAEFKSAFDKSTVDAVEAKSAFDAQLNSATADAFEMKAGWDKSTADAVEAKTVFDSQLNKANADAAEFKSAFDKSTVDAVEAKSAFDAQLNSATADAFEMKAGWDKSTADAVEAKTESDSQLNKANADAAEFKSAFDKSTVDAVEAKSAFDAQLNSATADAFEMKAGWDKSTADAVEAKTESDSQLNKANADAAEFKSAFDKSTVDAVEAKSAFDAQLNSATADAFEMKAGWDKALIDALELKLAFDKSTVDAVEAKTVYNSQLHKATADASEMKAGWDKTAEDAIELKMEFDEQAAQLQKAQADTSEMALQRAQAELEANFVKEALNNQQEALHNLQDEHAKLVHQRDVLHAELQLALNNYQPKATIDAGTPADKMLMMLTELLDGTVPSIQDILYVQSAILESLDIYQPVDLGKQLLAANAMDQEVGLALLSQLGAGHLQAPTATDGVSLEDFCSRRATRNSSDGLSGDTASLDGSAATHMDSFHTLEKALCCMFSPGFDYAQAQPDADGAGRMGAVLHRKAMRPGQDSLRVQTHKSRKPVRSSPMGLKRPSSSSQVSEDEYVEDDTFPEPNAGPMVDEMVRVLESANHWQFDAFKLCEVTEGHTLSALGYYTLHQAGLINHFRMKPTHLARFLRAVEDGYINNPYHNKTHAADVLQTFHLILRRGGLIPGYVDPLTHVACLLAAVVHDFEHVGRTNDFLINTGSDLAILYNDRAPLENHHLAAAFQLLRKPEFNFMPDLTKAEHDKLRKTVIDLVLATDMKQHFSIVSHFTTVHRLGSGGSMAPSVASLPIPRRSLSCGSSNNNSLFGGAGSGVDDEEAQIVVPLDETERMISLQLALKCADLGEFFRQGDAERAAGLPISPLFDRMKQGISKSQVGFFDIVVIPLYHSFSRVFTGTKPLLTFVMRNYKVWNEQQRLAGGAQ